MRQRVGNSTLQGNHCQRQVPINRRTADQRRPNIDNQQFVLPVNSGIVPVVDERGRALCHT
eukprot:8005147-Alexandrium_andersonii.AAC.1